MTRLTRARLSRLVADLPARYTTPLTHLGTVQLLSGDQLDRLTATQNETTETTQRVRRRIMSRLTDLGLVATLERRVGGVRAGSAGHLYTLTAAGVQAVHLLNGQPPAGRVRRSRAPGQAFLGHALAVSEIYVQLVARSSTGDFKLVTFAAEPTCWWPRGDGTYLKPDAYLLLRATSHADCWWLEIDNNTETMPRIARKCRVYLDHYADGGAGPDGAAPRVLFTAPNTARRDAIAAVTVAEASYEAALAGNDVDLIAATTHDQAVVYIINELQDQDPRS